LLFRYFQFGLTFESIKELGGASRILDQTLCLKNDHFLPGKLDKFIFPKNLKHLFRLFLGMTFENTLLVYDMLHKSMFNTFYNAIFFKTFYESHTNGNHLFNIVLLYLESLHFSRMHVYKFVDLNPFGSFMNVAFGDPWYEKLNVHCSAKCDETFIIKLNQDL